MQDGVCKRMIYSARCLLTCPLSQGKRNQQAEQPPHTWPFPASGDIITVPEEHPKQDDLYGPTLPALVTDSLF